MAQHIECRYCDMGFPTKYDGNTICGGCGAECGAAKILVESDDED
ncbi:hypothetical protein [Peribacillus huizhouensis]|uniref:Uncharacterized protein n=1 Tax=Peribacillus huizhouensis TaxID=1501239 RepID=A0ABR6CR10_9BACI|nr:hypothetical protein [Peribacillus huizhouensis]MBA9027473.1 hypothetical protein [Peribacillus huizhouensis]